MALITISGYPCSGKTKRVEQLRQHLERHIADPAYLGPLKKVVSISDDTLNIDRVVYGDGRAEKPARAALFTAMQRQMGSDTLLIIDDMNYIKGFRYQMYCAAREQKVRVATVFVVAQPEHCKAWNAAREDGRAYPPTILDNLIMRFEEPSSMVRWDSPLFTVLWTEEDVPELDIWRAVTEGFVKPPNAGTTAVPIAPSDALHNLEHVSTSMVSAIMADQAASQGGFGGSVTTLSLPMSTKQEPVKICITLPARNLTLSEMQRHKRQFVHLHKKATTLGTTEKGAVDWSEEAVAQKFATYLEEHMKP